MADCIIAISAIVRANAVHHGRTPLFKLQVGNCAVSHHYSQAIKHHTKAMGLFRRRLSETGSSAVAPRTMLVSTILFTTFELLQGNTAACDKFTSLALSILKDKLPHRADAVDHSLVTAPLDDSGVFDAEFYLTRNAAFNSLFSPIYPLTAQGLGRLNLSTMAGVDPPGITSSLEDFCLAWWRMLTVTVVWFQRMQVLGAKGYAVHEDLKVLESNERLGAQTASWLAPTQQRLRTETNPDARFRIEITLCGVEIVCISLRCGTYLTGELWDMYAEECWRIVSHLRRVIESRPFVSLVNGKSA